MVPVAEEKLDLEARTRDNAVIAEHLGPEQRDARFDLARALRQIVEIFERVSPRVFKLRRDES